MALPGPPPAIRWLCFPAADGAVRGDLVWEDGLSRGHERGAFDRFQLEGALEGGAFAPRLRRLRLASGCGFGRHEAWVPGPDARWPWFASTWTRAPLALA